jgi:putative membrane protein
MYGWMNVLSTLDPYSEESTSRIKIAVATEDTGTDFYGMNINMGNMVADALKANKTIGWVFPDTADEAVEGVESGDYYAAIVVPAEFSSEMIAFRRGDYTHPQIIYYENNKSNIIASKVTELAKDTVREEINSTFISSLVKAVISAANVSSGMGLDGYDTYNDIISKLNDLSEDMDYMLALTHAMDSLTDASGSMIGTTQSFLPVLDGLLGDTSDELQSVWDRLESGQGDYDDLRQSSVILLQQTIDTLDAMDLWFSAAMDDTQTLIDDSQESLTNLADTLNKLNSFLDDSLEYIQDITPNTLEINSAYKHASNMIDAADSLLTPLMTWRATDAASQAQNKKFSTDSTSQSQYAYEAEKTKNQADNVTDSKDELSDALKDIRKYLRYARDDIEGMQKSVNRLNNSATDALNAVNTDLGNLAKDLVTVEANLKTDIADTNESLANLIDRLSEEQKLDIIIDIAQDDLTDVIDLLGSTDGVYNSAMSSLDSYASSLSSISGNLDETGDVVSGIQSVIQSVLIGMMDFEGEGSLDRILRLTDDDADTLSDYLSEPVVLDTVAVYETDNYGSASAPFYTLLALWAGALFTMAIFKARVDEKDRPKGLKSWQEFIGRYAMIFVLGQIQALVTGLGIAFYIGIDCVHPWLYVLGCSAASLTFTLINFALRYSMDSVGLGLSIIIILLQVAGSGGSFPVEVLPELYQKLYPYMPFKPALAMMRETIGGMYGNVYWESMLHLIAFGIAAIPVGLILKIIYSPIYKWMEKGKEKTGIMV